MEEQYYEYDLDPIDPIVPIMPHADEGDAILAIMEQLYDSANSIDESVIRGSFAYLCEKLGVSKDLLKEPEGLCVVHWKEAQKRKVS